MKNDLNLATRNLILAGLCFGAINFLVKWLSDYNSLLIIFYRSIVTFVITGTIIYQKKIYLFPKGKTKMLFLRGLFGSVALVAFFTTIQKINLATAVTLTYLSPIVAVILGWLVSKETLRPFQLFFLVMASVGVLLLKEGSIAGANNHFFYLGLFAAFFAASAYVTISKIGKDVSHHLIIFYFPLVTLPMISYWVFSTWITPNLTDLILLLLTGLLTQVAQTFLTKAYTLAPVGKISHWNYLTVLYASLVGVLFFGEHYTLLNYTGMVIVIVSVIMANRLR